MANIFDLENFTDFSEKINIDELYEKKRQIDVNKLELFKKILNRIHVRIFISWDHWVPTYVRTEIKKKTGVNINEYGEKIEDEKGDDEDTEYQQVAIKGNPNLEQIKNSKKYTPINSYKPSGKLVYSEDLLNKLGDKMG